MKRLNLAPAPTRRPPLSLAAWALCAVVVGVLAIQSALLSAQVAALSAEQTRLAPQVAALETRAGSLRAELAAAAAAQRALAALRARAAPYAAVFALMERAAPADLWLQTASLRADGVRLGGAALRWAEVGDFARVLSDRYGATLDSITRESTALPVYRFTLNVPAPARSAP